ncbi:hypothetical protein LCGC14_2434970 [marine sediment metagenome]|uniref:Uncharacterized protein n=1 Tax=marine sediment metagenome TaxID=412755 RepID=A0A0F9BKQ9_9ZZZZ
MEASHKIRPATQRAYWLGQRQARRRTLLVALAMGAVWLLTLILAILVVVT